jgi:hypothetical protein
MQIAVSNSMPKQHDDVLLSIAQLSFWPSDYCLETRDRVEIVRGFIRKKLSLLHQTIPIKMASLGEIGFYRRDSIATEFHSQHRKIVPMDRFSKPQRIVGKASSKFQWEATASSPVLAFIQSMRDEVSTSRNVTIDRSDLNDILDGE